MAHGVCEVVEHAIICKVIDVTDSSVNVFSRAQFFLGDDFIIMQSVFRIMQ